MNHDGVIRQRYGIQLREKQIHVSGPGYSNIKWNNENLLLMEFFSHFIYNLQVFGTLNALQSNILSYK